MRLLRFFKEFETMLGERSGEQRSIGFNGMGLQSCCITWHGNDYVEISCVVGMALL